MARIFKYAILTAVPDPRRGERVNVGLAVFCEDRIDVRLKDAAAAIKLRALTGESWERPLEAARTRIGLFHNYTMSPDDMCAAIAERETVFKPSTLSWFTVDHSSDYETRIAEILRTLVFSPPAQRTERQSRINTEISAHFRRVGLLADREQTINDHKIVRNFPVAENEGLIADFALKNGAYCFAATLDLRGHSTPLAQAALKAITLDKATRYDTGVSTIGVYAVSDAYKVAYDKHISLLTDYANATFNWTDPTERTRFERSVYDMLPYQFGDRNR